MDEFLITSNVVLSFNLERVWCAAAACLDREKEDADYKAIDRARELGSRLYFDPTGPTSKYGLETVVFDQVGTSSSGEKDDAYQPAKLVNELESTGRVPVAASRMGTFEGSRGARRLVLTRSAQGRATFGLSARRRH